MCWGDAQKVKWEYTLRTDFELLQLYDKESAKGSNWVSQGGESESGQMVLKKVKWTYFDAYLCQTMWNHAKKTMKKLKRPNWLFLQG